MARTQTYVVFSNDDVWDLVEAADESVYKTFNSIVRGDDDYVRLDLYPDLAELLRSVLPPEQRKLHILMAPSSGEYP